MSSISVYTSKDVYIKEHTQLMLLPFSLSSCVVLSDQVMLAAALQRRVKEYNITVSSVEPGYVSLNVCLSSKFIRLYSVIDFLCTKKLMI